MHRALIVLVAALMGAGIVFAALNANAREYAAPTTTVEAALR